MSVTSLLLSPITWAVVSLYFLYWYGTKTFDYFTNQGIPGPKPLPYIGNTWGAWRQNIPKHDRELAKKYGKTFGYFEGAFPTLWTTDVNLIKSVFIKDFDCFVNRRELPIYRKVYRKIIAFIENKEWKDVRSAITPVFSAGKIKLMSVMIKECTDRLITKFHRIAAIEGQFDAIQFLSTFTMDVIARCVFGMKINNLGEKNDPFVTKAKTVFCPAVLRTPFMLIAFAFPKLTCTLADGLILPYKIFLGILEDLIKERSNSTEKYHDFVEIAKDGIANYKKIVDGKEVSAWSKEEVEEIVIAQSLAFLLVGSDTTATTLTNATFLLAKNPEVQEKLHQQIIQKLEQFEDVNHEMIIDFPYVDHIIHEVLRMYPPVPRLERWCNKDFNYNEIHIKKKIRVVVPLFALHYNEEYYPDPYKFNPDRWNPENEIKPNPYAFMPFGMGPRNCIGMRFAVEEMKYALCNMVLKFRFFPVAETPDELEFRDGFFLIIPHQHTTVNVGIELR